MYRTYAIRSAILSLIVNLGFLWLVNDALAAADYYTIGIGHTRLERNRDFGWWNQSTSDQIFNESSPSWSIRAGWNITQNLQIEAGYRDLGKFSTIGSFISDTGYNNVLNSQCAYPCGEQVVSVYGEGNVHGAELRLKYGHQIGQFRPYATIGAFGYRSSYRTAVVVHDNTGSIYPDLRWSEYRIRPAYSFGIEYKTAFIEYTLDRHIGTEFSAFDKAQTITFGVRF